MIEMTLSQLESLLNEQKLMVIEKLVGQSGVYNAESDEGNYRPLNIDKEKFKQEGMKSSYPKDFNVLKRYIKSD